MLWVLQHLLRIATLYYFTCLHYHYPVADVVYYCQVVGDEEVSELKFCLQIFKEVQYLRLHAYIQCRYAFITDQQLGS